MSKLEQEMLLGIVSDETILEVEKTLSTDDFQRYTFMAQTQKKSDLVAWLLWIFLGQFQIHMVYLNIFNDRHLRVLRIVGLVLLYFFIGWIVILPLWIYDAIKMSSYINEANNMEKAKVLKLFIEKEEKEAPVAAEVVLKKEVVSEVYEPNKVVNTVEEAQLVEVATELKEDTKTTAETNITESDVINDQIEEEVNIVELEFEEEEKL